MQYVGSHYLQAELKILNYLNVCAVKTAGGEQPQYWGKKVCLSKRVCVCARNMQRKQCRSAVWNHRGEQCCDCDSSATVLNWFCFRTLILHWTLKGKHLWRSEMHSFYHELQRPDNTKHEIGSIVSSCGPQLIYTPKKKVLYRLWWFHQWNKWIFKVENVSLH